ncbi:MAG: hypothetical protein K8R67_10935 [Desulfobacteraceae bacterium]|nr:hypothetical protein [Desulfobacteraceae bacterium]
MENNDTKKGADKTKDAKKAAMKELRAQRKTMIAAASSKMKEQKKDIKAIKEFLKGQEATIPEIAEGIDMSKDKILWYMATLKKYGQIVEGPKEGVFFKYFLSESDKTQEKAEV